MGYLSNNNISGYGNIKTLEDHEILRLILDESSLIVDINFVVVKLSYLVDMYIKFLFGSSNINKNR